MQTTNTPPPINRNIFNVGFVLIFFLVLGVSNPGKPEFKRYLKSNIQPTKLVAGPAAWAVDVTTERHEYFFFSVYEVGVFDDKQIFIGVLGHFVRI